MAWPASRTSNKQILEHLANASDVKVVWLFLEHPVIAAFGTKKHREFCQLDTAASTDQVSQLIKQMDIVLTSPPESTFMRPDLGSHEIVANLAPAADGVGFTINQGLVIDRTPHHRIEQRYHFEHMPVI